MERVVKRFLLHNHRETDEVKESDFDILKTRERLVEHDEIYQKICMKLEWTFIPTV